MNMFARKPKSTTSQTDELNRKKLAGKVLDVKKDLNSRLRYLKSYIESSENISDLKQFFDINYSQIYFLFYESFVNVETNIKQKLNKLNKEELETILYIFQKILLLQPERLHQRWQVRSIGRIIQKLLHMGNTKLIKFYGIRLFLIWYQILNTNKTHVEELMFQKLIQGFDTFHSSVQAGGGILNSSIGINMLNAEAQKVFNQYDALAPNSSNSSSISIGRSLYPFEITPIIPNEQQANSSQQQTQQQQAQQMQATSTNGYAPNSVYSLTAEMLRKMLEYMQQDCLTIEWYGDKLQQSQKCYEFLFDEFKRFYLAYMFPSAFITNSVRNLQYNSNAVQQQTQQSSLNVYSNTDLLQLLNEQQLPTFDRPLIGSMSQNDERKLAQLHCKEEIIKWLISVLLIDPIGAASAQPSSLLSNNAALSSTASYISINSSMSSTNQSIAANSQFISSSMSSNVLNNNQLTSSSSVNDQLYGSSISTVGTLTSGYESNSSLRLGDSDTLRAFSQDDIMSSISDIESNLFELSQGSVSVNMTPVSNHLNTATASSSTTLTNMPSNNTNKQLIQKVILSTMSNVNLVHEILRNAYFLNFEDYTTVQRVLNAYKKWFLRESKPPLFMQEQTNTNQLAQQQPTTPISAQMIPGTPKDLDNSSTMSSSILDDDKSNWSGISSSTTNNTTNDTSSSIDQQHLQRTYSISSSIFSNNSIYSEQTRIGYIRCLQIFFYHSSNLLLNRNNLHRDRIKNVCCYTLEIYKLFIRKIKMDQQTWNLLITILLRITDFLFNSEYLISNRNDPSTSHLIKLITETVLLAIIRASFSFSLNSDLWNQLMVLLSSFNSNIDVVDRWIEVIDDLIRQVFKMSYNIDINNYLLMNEVNLDQKRKRKDVAKKTYYASQPMQQAHSPGNKSSITSLNHFQQVQSNQPVLQQPKSIPHQQQQQPQQQVQQVSQQQLVKTRAKTEIYPSSVLANFGLQSSQASPNSPSLTSSSATISSTTNQTNNNQKPMAASNSTIINTTSPSISNNLNSQSNSIMSASKTALLTRQPKSPSLRDEHFLALNDPPSGSPISKDQSNKNQNFSPNSIDKSPTSVKQENQNSEQTDDEVDSNEKSATLKAKSNNNMESSPLKTNINHLNTNSGENKEAKTINRFNSDKSIYYSSEIINESSTITSQNTNGNLEIDDESNTSSNNSQINNVNSSLTSPVAATNQTSAKVSPTQTHQTPSQQPPPLPPLPPSLASKYYLTKTLLLDQESLQNRLANESAKMSGSQAGTPLANGDQVDFNPVDVRNERRLKGMSTCSELDVYFKDYINSAAPHIDTNSSEAASNSGGELSGDTFASPILNSDIIIGTNTGLQSLDFDAANVNLNNSLLTSQSTLLLQPINNMNITNANEGYLNSTASSTTNTTATTDKSSISDCSGMSSLNVNTNGLLSIDSRHDERSASFIDSKYLVKDQSSKASTLTANSALPLNETAINQSNSQPNVNTNTNNNNLEVQSANTNSYILIKRLFGCLGNVNTIKDPLIHKKIFEFIYNKWERLGKIKDDLKLSDLSQIILPLSHFAPWLYESIYQLSYNYQIGKLIAYKTLCRMVIRSNSLNLMAFKNDFDYVSDEFMDLFYITIHQGLRSDDKSITNCIIQNCGTKFWHCMIPSSTLLIKDFLDACATVDNQAPKLEAASILGCLIPFPDYFGDMKVLNHVQSSPNSSQLNNSNSSKTSNASNDDNFSIDFFTKDELKSLIVHSLTSFTDDYLNTNSRSVVLCSLTCFIYDQILNHKWNHQRLNDSIKRIFKDLDFRESFNPVLVKMSCDNLRFLSVLATVIFQNEIQYAINIINELNQCLVKLINSKPSIINEDYEKAIIANMFALLEWCMNMPLDQLKDQDRATLLRNNFKLILHISSTFKPNDSIESEHIHLSARFIISHLLNQLNHFPFGSAGPTKIVSSVNETSDLGLNFDELSPILFEQPNLQFFTVNNQFLISFIELPMKANEKFFNISPKLKTSSTICRFVVRDFCGKNCWDCCFLHSPDESLPTSYFLDIPFKNEKPINNDTDAVDPNEVSSFDFTNLTSLSKEEIPKDIDILDIILQYVSYSSPECRLEANKPLNIIWDINPYLTNLLNIEEVKQKIVNEHTNEQGHVLQQHENEMQQLENKKNGFLSLKDTTSHQSNESRDSLPPNANIQSYFHLCKSFIHQMGLLSWEKRQSFNLLRKSPQLLRELKSLDDQTCRETHKIAIIYIAEGQEERSSILSNESGSQDYEDFLKSLAWTVDLEKHEGFMGGLQHNYQLKTAPYYANSICEVLFHVSTQMNNPNDQNKISKWRHMGNDSVQIIWSEHTKDYDRNILATEFADVLICIYPLRNGLFRIQIIKKPSVGYFGPLFDGAIINKQSLPTLIRATAINASRILLSNTKGYQDFFVHRTHSINNIIRTLTEKQTSEQFIADIYAPAIINTTTNALIKKDNQQQDLNSDYNKS